MFTCCTTEDDSAEGLPALGANSFWTTERSAPNRAESAGEAERLAGLSLRELRQRALSAAVGEKSEEAVGVALETPASGNNAAGQDAELERFRAELQAMPMKDLRPRADASGLSVEQLDMVADSDNPKQAIVALLVEEHASARKTVREGGKGSESNAKELREQLQGLRLRELKRRALAEGISSETVDAADDSDEPKHTLIEALLQAARQSPRQAAAAEKLRGELSELKLSALKRRALAEGVSSGAVEAADDSDDPKELMIEMLLSTAAEKQKKPQAKSIKPHFGEAVPTQSRAGTEGAAPVAGGRQLVPRGKHVMLSYQCEFWATVFAVAAAVAAVAAVVAQLHCCCLHDAAACPGAGDYQAEVSQAREKLSKRGVACWMDVSRQTPLSLLPLLVATALLVAPADRCFWCCRSMEG